MNHETNVGCTTKTTKPRQKVHVVRILQCQAIDPMKAYYSVCHFSSCTVAPVEKSKGPQLVPLFLAWMYHDVLLIAVWLPPEVPTGFGQVCHPPEIGV